MKFHSQETMLVPKHFLPIDLYLSIECSMHKVITITIIGHIFSRVFVSLLAEFFFRFSPHRRTHTHTSEGGNNANVMRYKSNQMRLKTINLIANCTKYAPN